MSSPLTPKQWITVILVNVVISVVTTLLIVRVLTNQLGVKPSAAPVPIEHPNEAKLEALTRQSEPLSPAPAPITAPEAATPVDLSKANEKLSSLLGKPK